MAQIPYEGYLLGYQSTYGLTLDNIVEAEIVLANGSQITISENHHPEIFWALRGGGGNLGVVTKFVFQLYPIEGPLAAGTVIYNWSDAGQMLKVHRDWMRDSTSDDRLTPMPGLGLERGRGSGGGDPGASQARTLRCTAQHPQSFVACASNPLQIVHHILYKHMARAFPSKVLGVGCWVLGFATPPAQHPTPNTRAESALDCGHSLC